MKQNSHSPLKVSSHVNSHLWCSHHKKLNYIKKIYGKICPPVSRNSVPMKASVRSSDCLLLQQSNHFFKTDNLTVMPTLHSDWPCKVWSSLSSLLLPSLLMSVQHHEWFRGETVWKGALLFLFVWFITWKRQRHAKHTEFLERSQGSSWPKGINTFFYL